MDSDINIEEEVIKVIVRDFAISRNNIHKNSTLEDLKIDKLSTDYVDLLSGLESKFEITIDEDDFLNVTNIEDIINLINKYIEIKRQNELNNENNNEEEFKEENNIEVVE